MRALSGSQVKACETGRHKRCKCRCGGALHGAKRSELVEYFEHLREDDPHWLKEKSRQLRLPAPIG